MNKYKPGDKIWLGLGNFNFRVAEFITDFEDGTFSCSLTRDGPDSFDSPHGRTKNELIESAIQYLLSKKDDK